MTQRIAVNTKLADAEAVVFTEMHRRYKQVTLFRAAIIVAGQHPQEWETAASRCAASANKGRYSIPRKKLLSLLRRYGKAGLLGLIEQISTAEEVVPDAKTIE